MVLCAKPYSWYILPMINTRQSISQIWLGRGMGLSVTPTSCAIIVDYRKITIWTAIEAMEGNNNTYCLGILPSHEFDSSERLCDSLAGFSVDRREMPVEFFWGNNESYCLQMDKILAN